MYNAVLAIPASLSEIWYVYDLILLAVILICIFILRLMRKKTNIKIASNCLKSAIKTLRGTQKVKYIGTLKLRLLSAYNSLKSAEYYYNLHIEEKDAYYMKQILEAVKTAVARVEEAAKGECSLSETQEETVLIIAELEKI